MMGICGPLLYRPPGLGSILILQASIVSVHDPPRLCFEPLDLLNFDFNADPDPDPAFHSKADPDSDPTSKYNAEPIRIRIHNTVSHQAYTKLNQYFLYMHIRFLNFKPALFKRKMKNNSEDCTESRIKFLFCLSFSLIGRLSPMYIHSAFLVVFQNNFSWTQAAFVTTLKVTGGYIGKPDQAS
jgi:hypothetical protein